MKKSLLMTFFVVTFFALTAVSAAAVENDTVKVGLRYGSTALFSANLENAVGDGYEFGYFDDSREFESLGWTDERAISMTAAGDIYMSGDGTYSASVPSGGYRHIGAWHVEISGFRDFDDAQDAAWNYNDAYPAWIDWEYVVRVGCYDSRSEAESAAAELGEGYAVKSSTTGVVVTVTRSTEILFEFDCSGILDLGVLPSSRGEEAVTWFKGYRYAGGFSYPRVTGGNLSVINVLDLEDYVKGVITSEMSGSWPLEALKAQAVCARTYACRTSKHLSASGFDVCATSDCQVYNGRGQASSTSDQAVEETAGEMLYYDGYLVQDPVYHASNGGATEDAANVWGTEKGYLKGKADPYESRTAISNYSWTVTYSASELSWILQQKGYDVGTVKNVYVSEYTPMGNVKKVVFEGSSGTKTVTGDTCRTIFYSSTYNKSVKSLRFSINGGGPVSGSGVYVNGSGDSLPSLDGVSVISGSGTITALDGDTVSAISSTGISTVTSGGTTAVKPTSGKTDSFTITGTGNGHNVGMSQYGAKAMAEAGYSYQDILEFYYTDITIW